MTKPEMQQEIEITSGVNIKEYVGQIIEINGVMLSVISAHGSKLVVEQVSNH